MGPVSRIYLIILGIAAGIILLWGPSESSDSPAPAIGKVTLMELGSEWCMPCKLMRPVLEKLKRDYPKDLKVIIVDVSKDKEAGSKYGIKVIPTQIFFDREGKEYKRHMGYLPEQEILKILKDLNVRE